MDIIRNKALKNIVGQKDFPKVYLNTLGSEISNFFENSNFHHLPVLSDKEEALGIISLGDYRQLQHHFTRFNTTEVVKENNKFFSSLLAEEIMTKNPVCLQESDTIGDALDIFLENKIHSIIICRSEKVVGILTPVDILKNIIEPALIQ